VPTQPRREGNGEASGASPAMPPAAQYKWEQETQLVDSFMRGSAFYLRDPEYAARHDHALERWMQGRVDACADLSRVCVGPQTQVATTHAKERGVKLCRTPSLSRPTPTRPPTTCARPLSFSSLFLRH